MHPELSDSASGSAGTGYERALARIDLSAVARNCATLKARLAKGSELCAVVKADGYGHGAVPCAQAALEGGASWLAVVTAGEAGELRRHGITEPLLVMGALTDRDVESALETDADLVAWRREFVELVAHKMVDRGGRARLHVKLDTGMGRLGTRDAREALALVDLIGESPKLELAGLMTHFATADEPDSGFFEEQLALFEPVARQVKDAHPTCVVHAANSAAVFRDTAAHFDMARCGIAVYGLDPFHKDPAARGLDPVLALESYVADVKAAGPGDSVGYGRTWLANRDTCVAVLPIGYGDGYRRGLSNRADVLVRGRRRPVVGTVSMDNITVDVGPGTDVHTGDVALLIGAQGSARILVEELAGHLGTINYEVTCGIAPRVRRLYERGDRDRVGP